MTQLAPAVDLSSIAITAPPAGGGSIGGVNPAAAAFIPRGGHVIALPPTLGGGGSGAASSASSPSSFTVGASAAAAAASAAPSTSFSYRPAAAGTSAASAQHFLPGGGGGGGSASYHDANGEPVEHLPRVRGRPYNPAAAAAAAAAANNNSSSYDHQHPQQQQQRRPPAFHNNSKTTQCANGGGGGHSSSYQSRGSGSGSGSGGGGGGGSDSNNNNGGANRFMDVNTTPIFRVQFRSHSDVYFCPDPDVQTGDYVMCTGDRGVDCGIVVGEQTLLPQSKGSSHDHRSSAPAPASMKAMYKGGVRQEDETFARPTRNQYIQRKAQLEEISTLLTTRQQQADDVLKLLTALQEDRAIAMGTLSPTLATPGLPQVTHLDRQDIVEVPLDVMDFVDCEFQFDLEKVIIYFKADSAVIFSKLAKLLHRHFRCRVWMHNLHKPEAAVYWVFGRSTGPDARDPKSLSAAAAGVTYTDDPYKGGWKRRMLAQAEGLQQKAKEDHAVAHHNNTNNTINNNDNYYNNQQKWDHNNHSNGRASSEEKRQELSRDSLVADGEESREQHHQQQQHQESSSSAAPATALGSFTVSAGERLSGGGGSAASKQQQQQQQQHRATVLATLQSRSPVLNAAAAPPATVGANPIFGNHQQQHFFAQQHAATLLAQAGPNATAGGLSHQVFLSTIQQQQETQLMQQATIERLSAQLTQLMHEREQERRDTERHIEEEAVRRAQARCAELKSSAGGDNESGGSKNNFGLQAEILSLRQQLQQLQYEKQEMSDVYANRLLEEQARQQQREQDAVDCAQAEAMDQVETLGQALVDAARAQERERDLWNADLQQLRDENDMLKRLLLQQRR